MFLPRMRFTPEPIRWNGPFPPVQSTHDANQFAHLPTDILTGAGQSIGSALAYAIYVFYPCALVLLDNSEQNLCGILSDLSPAGSRQHIPVPGSVADERCLSDTCERFRPEIVYHAVAFKHVPLIERNPLAVVQKNVFGTSTLARIAHGGQLLMISTDRAADPQSIMGVSKRLTELLLLGMPGGQTRTGSIRLSNVPGSEAAVVPLFLEQIARRGRLTVTGPDVERNLLTMDETVYRVLSAAATCSGDGAIAIPVLGDPVKIAELARYLIAQTGAGDVAISFTGLLLGDKFEEAFVSFCESNGLSPIDGTHWIDSSRLPDAELATGLAELSAAIDTLDLLQLLSTLIRLVPEYEPRAFPLQQTPISQFER